MKCIVAKGEQYYYYYRYNSTWAQLQLDFLLWSMVYFPVLPLRQHHAKLLLKLFFKTSAQFHLTATLY